MRKPHDMVSGAVWPTFLYYSLPWALSMLASGSAAIIDGIFIGRYAGALALASVNIIAPVWGFMAGVGIMFAAGGSAIAGNHMGRNDMEGASAMLVKTLLAVLVWCALFFCVFFIFQDKILPLLGGIGELEKDSRTYLRVLLYFTPAFPLGFALSYFVRLDGRPVLASMGLVVCAMINAPLDWLLIGVLGLGVYGAALATGVAYSVPCLLYATHFISPRCTYVWPRSLGKWREILSAAWNGSSEFVNETSAGVVILLFNITLLKSMGSQGVAAFTVIGYAGMMGALLCYGFADTLTPLISVNNGAGKRGRVRAFLLCSLAMVLGIGLAILVFLSFWPELLALLFLPDAPQAREIALDFVRAARWEFIFLGLNMALTSYFTGKLWASASFTVALCRALALPCILLWLLPLILGPTGIFYVPSLTEGLTFGVACCIFWLGARGDRRKKRRWSIFR